MIIAIDFLLTTLPRPWWHSNPFSVHLPQSSVYRIPLQNEALLLEKIPSVSIIWPLPIFQSSTLSLLQHWATGSSQHNSGLSFSLRPVWSPIASILSFRGGQVSFIFQNLFQVSCPPGRCARALVHGRWYVLCPHFYNTVFQGFTL